MKTKFVLLIALVTFVMSIMAMPIYNAGVALWDRQQLYKEMRTDPAYQVRSEIELQNPFVSVLTVDDSRPQMTMAWILIDGTFTMPEYYTIISQVAVAMAEHYSSSYYAVMVGQIGEIRTIDDTIVYVYGRYFYIFDAEGVAALVDTDGCILEKLGELHETGQFEESAMRQKIYCPSILQREPGYEWPWE